MTDAARHAPEMQTAIEDAAMWYARLLPGATGLDDRQALERAFARWRDQDARHARAWDTVQAMSGRMAHIPAGIALPTLGRPHPGRRAALRALGVVALGGGAVLGLRQMPWTQWQADHATAPGERRSVTLADGSVLELDTRTALDVDFGVSARAVHLHAGAIVVSTQPDTRPFMVQTAHGRIQALGTRFEVRADEAITTVTVLEAAVLVSRTESADASVRVQAGERMRLTRSGMEPPAPAPIGAGAWVTGQLVLWDRPLAEVAAELARYRRGWLACDPAVAGLRISGVLPIDDTDAALDALEDSFPVRVERQWGGWRTRIGPR